MANFTLGRSALSSKVFPFVLLSLLIGCFASPNPKATKQDGSSSASADGANTSDLGSGAGVDKDTGSALDARAGTPSDTSGTTTIATGGSVASGGAVSTGGSTMGGVVAGGGITTGGVSVSGGVVAQGGANGGVTGGATGGSGSGRDASVPDTSGTGGVGRDGSLDVPVGVMGGSGSGGVQSTGGIPGTGGVATTGGVSATGGVVTGGVVATGGTVCVPASVGGASTLSIDVSAAKTTIQKELFGVGMERIGRQFSQGGLFVGTESSLPKLNGMRTDILDGLKEAGVGLIQFPGGCSANAYNWSANKSPSNDVGTDRFLELCGYVGAEPYLTGRPTSADATSNAAWVDYVQGKVPLKYFKVGSDVWECGGMQTETVYEANYTANYQALSGKNLFVVAGGHVPSMSGGWAWFESLITNIGSSIDGIELHDYIYFPTTVSSTSFDEAQYYDIVRRANTGQIQPNIDKLISILDQRDPAKRIKIVVDEWGNWLKPVDGNWQQQNSVMDAISAAEYLHVYMARADRIQIAVHSQAVNVMQSLFLTNTDGVLAKTPTFYVFKMFNAHHTTGAKLAPSTLQSETMVFNGTSFPVLSAVATVNTQGVVNTSLVNVDAVNPRTVQLSLPGTKSYTVTSAQIITGPAINSYNPIGGMEVVNIQPLFTGSYSVCDKTISVTLPARSVVMLALTPQ